MRAQGARIGSYRLLRPLRDAQAGGAFLAVHRGANGFEKQVLLRCAEARSADRVIHEAKRAALVSHSAVAHVLDAGLDGDACFVVSEHSAGLSLRAHLVREGRLPWRTVARVVAEVAEGLAHAHGRRGDDGALLGLVHRRLCPRRITVTEAGRAKLTGLGTSWAWPNHDGFVSPEERRNEPLDGRADVFSLGRTLQSCIVAGEAPETLTLIAEQATSRWPERRPTALRLQESLLDLLAGYSPAGAGSSVAGSGSSAAASGISASASAAAASSAS